MDWTTALAIAAAFWGHTDCRIDPVRERTPPGVLGFAYPEGCQIIVTRRRLSWEKFCTVVVHEYGHLRGHGHSRNPRAVMYPRYLRSFRHC